MEKWGFGVDGGKDVRVCDDSVGVGGGEVGVFGVGRRGFGGGHCGGGGVEGKG